MEFLGQYQANLRGPVPVKRGRVQEREVLKLEGGTGYILARQNSSWFIQKNKSCVQCPEQY